MTVQEYIKADRQWPRHLRIAHAKYQLKRAMTKADRAFWDDVLKANELGA